MELKPYNSDTVSVMYKITLVRYMEIHFLYS